MTDMAHEMGHVVLRHPLENMLSQLGVILVMNVVAGGSSSDIAGLGAMFATTSYTRDYERLADDFALTVLKEAAINPLAYADLFERFNQAEVSASSGFLGLSDLLSTHPNSLDRAALAAQAGTAKSMPSLNEATWNSIVALCQEEDDDDNSNGRVDRNGRNINSPVGDPSL